MIRVKWNIRAIGLFLLIGILSSCLKEEKLNVEQKEEDLFLTELDLYIEENFTQEFGVAVRYKFVDNYVDPTQRVAPPKVDIVRPMLDFVYDFWVLPFLEVGNGEEFFRNHVPAELIFLGGLIFNGDGTVTLGTADAGARVTFTDVNSFDLVDLDWRQRQLHTVYHEFAHIVHQNYKLPSSFETISSEGYTSAGSWFNLGEEEALIRGFVSPYGTSSPNEDFAEIIAFYLYEEDFYTYFIDLESDCESALCESRNAGRLLLLDKLNAIKKHYKNVTGIDLEELRSVIQSKL